ncbi:MAG: cytochrome c3 family protein [Gemmatimonadota bacterium]|nr:cytochrome c3 family protein [Gemmatimonadota bacterium]
MIGRTVGGALLALSLATSALLSMSRAEPFPHEEHAGLFPTCLGCHGGIPDGATERFYSVTAGDCARCHDGVREETVEWLGPDPTPSNLVYSHVEHVELVERAEEATLACADCHGPVEPGGPRMAVGRAAPETCVGCHADEVEVHLDPGADCSDCHVSLVDSPEISQARVAAFPEPPTHESDTFVLEHGAADLDVSTCAVCHARQSCARCHLNASDVPTIEQLAPDPRVESLLADSTGEWPEPPDHDLTGWDFVHGEEARTEPAACATCHTQTSCGTCHRDVRNDAIAVLPTTPVDGPVGVVIAPTRPPGHLPDFGTRHGAAVASDMPSCASCHLEDQCAACHERSANESANSVGTAGGAPESDAALFLHSPGAPPVGTLPPEPRPGYHPDNFVTRHGAESFSLQTNCADCHSTEVFCRDCHESSGFAVGVGGGAGGAFHDAQPNWFFEHGRAARQGMEGCASCHQQTSCLRCHSAKAGLRISPHGPSFDPTRLAARSTISCGVCHTGDQIPPP